jgi:hypothetical protein
MTIYVIIEEKNEKKIKHSEENIVFIRSVNNDNEDKNYNQEDVFVSYIHDTTIQMRLDNYEIPHDALCIVTVNKNLDSVLSDDEHNYEQDYYLFSGNAIKNLIPESKKAVIRNLKTLAFCVYQMLDAGYLQEEDNQKIADWIAPCEEPTLKLFKNYLQLETSNPHKTVEDEFIINPQFRKMILVNMMQILANYIINNEMITVEEVSKMGNWMEEKTWNKLNKKLKLLQKE